jgi:hypothetical protein
MGLPYNNTVQPSSIITNTTSPTTLSLILRSLPPDKFRTTLSSLFDSMNIIPISHLLIASVDIEEIDTSTILQPRRESPLNDAQIEEKLANGKYTLSLNDSGERIWTANAAGTSVNEEVNAILSDRNRLQRITQRMVALRREIEEESQESDEETGTNFASEGYLL